MIASKVPASLVETKHKLLMIMGVSVCKRRRSRNTRRNLNRISSSAQYIYWYSGSHIGEVLKPKRSPTFFKWIFDEWSSESVFMRCYRELMVVLYILFINIFNKSCCISYNYYRQFNQIVSTVIRCYFNPQFVSYAIFCLSDSFGRNAKKWYNKNRFLCIVYGYFACSSLKLFR